jgi:hypothetical protein
MAVECDATVRCVTVVFPSPVAPRMPKLLVQQVSLDYHGFFQSPAYDLMGEGAKIMGGLAKAFSSYNVGLGNFRTEVDVNEPAANSIIVTLGQFGIYRFKFDQVQAGLRNFTSDDDIVGLVSAIEKGDAWLRSTIEGFAFRSHAFVYSSHSSLSAGTSQSFLLSIPRREKPIVIGKDLGSGVLETWEDPDLGARVHLTLGHSLVQTDGIYINYMVVFETERIDYAAVASKGRALLDRTLKSMGLEFWEEEVTL